MFRRSTTKFLRYLSCSFLFPWDIDFLHQISFEPISILQAAEKNKADIEKYKLQQQAEANEALYSDK